MTIEKSGPSSLMKFMASTALSVVENKAITDLKVVDNTKFPLLKTKLSQTLKLLIIQSC